MKIVIAGAGEVGKHLAKMLSNEYHDITVIDDNIRNIDIVKSFSDVYGVEGDPCRIDTLMEANVGKSSLFISVTPDESRNILAAAIAKNLGSKKCIARIDNDEYLKPNNKEMFINMGIDYMFYPEDIAAKEILTLLGNTTTTEYVNFSKEKLVMLVFKLAAASPVIGRTLQEITKDKSNLNYRTIAICRDEDTIIPKGTTRLKKGDMLYVITNKDYTNEVMEMSGNRSTKVKNVMILGGGLMGERVALELQGKMNIKLIEYKDERARQLRNILDRQTLVISADGRDGRVMEDENLKGMDAFIAVTGRSETNILSAMMAKKAGVKKVIAEVENFNFISLAESMGVDTIINKKLITAGNIFKFTMTTDVQAIKCLNGCDAEVLEFIAKPGSMVTKRSVRQLALPEGVILGGGVRGEDKVFIVTGDTIIKAFDRIVVFALPEAISKIAKFFD